MFSRVLFATDFSPASERALDCLARWRRFGLTAVTLAHVHDVQYAGGFEEGILREDGPKIEHQQSFVSSRGLEASSRIQVGIPQFELDRTAKEEGCEAIVVGSHGASWLAEVMIGSIADAVLRHSAFPVFVIKVNRLVDLSEKQCEDTCTSMFTDILFPTDLSDETVGAAVLVERLCRKYKSAVRLLHVLDTAGVLPYLSDYGDVERSMTTEQLDLLAARLTSAGASSVSIELIREAKVDGILHEIEAHKPGLVVVGKHGRGHLAEILLGSISHAVACSSIAPVLVVPRTLRAADLAEASVAGAGEFRGAG